MFPLTSFHDLLEGVAVLLKRGARWRLGQNVVRLVHVDGLEVHVALVTAPYLKRRLDLFAR